MTKNNKLIIVRHGVRGITNPKMTKCCIPYFNEDNNLSLYGHIYSYKLGKLISKRFGEPSLIYANNDSERTIATGIAIAKGCELDKIKIGCKKDDPYFAKIPLSEENIIQAREILKANENKIKTLENAVSKCVSCVVLSKESSINDNGDLEGLLHELDLLVNVPSFSSLSNSGIQFNNCSKIMELAFDIKQNVLYVPDIVSELGRKLLGGINYLLHKERLSILIGHDSSNIAVIGKFLNKTFDAPGFAKGYIPANSGYIFTLYDNYIKVEILYLDIDGKFNIKCSQKIAIPNWIYVPQLTDLCI